MLEYIHGKVDEVTPTNCIIDIGGMGYNASISLNTYSQIQDKHSVKLFLHEVIREDSYTLYGFYDPEEREMFRMLISVSGVGANTARMILSSMTSQEVKQSILSGNAEVLKSIKGIGAKSAQRIIIDLKDKVGKAIDASAELIIGQDNTLKKEALSALEILGFAKKQSEKVIDRIIKKDNNITVEQLIKEALVQL